MGINCAPLVADLFDYERDFMLSLAIIRLMLFRRSTLLQYILTMIILNIDNPYFEQVVTC